MILERFFWLVDRLIIPIAFLLTYGICPGIYHWIGRNDRLVSFTLRLNPTYRQAVDVPSVIESWLASASD